LSQRRGNEASGLVSISGKKLVLFKQAVKPVNMLRTKGYAGFIKKTVTGIKPEDPIVVLGHVRLVTNGSQAISDNNQPITSGHISGVHNGIFTNDKEVCDKYEKTGEPLDNRSDSDTEVLFALINRYYEKGYAIESAVVKSFQELEGAASVAFLSDSTPAMVLATNTGSLYYSFQKDRGGFVFGSENDIVEKFLRTNTIGMSAEPGVITQIVPHTVVVVRFDTMTLTSYPFGSVKAGAPQTKAGHSKLFDLEDLSVKDTVLRRCTKCVLPETFPFISFDEHGVCNYCRRYQRQVYKGKDAVMEVLEKYRSKDGRPDCIVGFSGGRDSSYGLHVLKKELDMHPIAFTYDWGMVTDLARRNQAKITGQLGIEHVIRSADIHTKRWYIRQNIYAWLKKPHLGMVPLFMAGDKMFYWYGRQLRKELGVKLTVFACGQQLEQMEFKIGFCGIDQPLTNNQKMYSYNFFNKMRMAAFYLSQYLLNPAYINESFLDSAMSYYYSFVSKDDYLYLYNYIPWDEEVIDRTLREEYQWEVDEKFGKNQWRMGDGHTAFIDYIYHTIAGFSEFDNFRSNQIREGLMTRETAMELLKEDNKPRVAMLRDFSQLVGFNLEDVLLKINTIPKLYER